MNNEIFYEIYDRQLLKTRALKREKPNQGGWFLVFTKLKAIQTPGLDLSFTWI